MMRKTYVSPLPLHCSNASGHRLQEGSPLADRSPSLCCHSGTPNHSGELPIAHTGATQRLGQRLRAYRTMEIKLIFKSDDEEVSCSLEEVTRSFLDGVQRIVRRELEVLVAQPVQKDGGTPSQPARPLALSKAKAAQALGISVRTIDYCIANHGIRVTRIGRRVLVPLNSLEALLKQGITEVRAPR